MRYSERTWRPTWLMFVPPRGTFNGAISEMPMVDGGRTIRWQMNGNKAIYQGFSQQHGHYQSPELVPPPTPQPRRQGLDYAPNDDALSVELAQHTDLSWKEAAKFFRRMWTESVRAKYCKILNGEKTLKGMKRLLANGSFGSRSCAHTRKTQTQDGLQAHAQEMQNYIRLEQQQAVPGAQDQMAKKMGINNPDLHPAHQRTFPGLIQQGNLPEGSLLLNVISRQGWPAPPVEHKIQFQMSMHQQGQQAQQPQARMQGQGGLNLKGHGNLALCSESQTVTQDLVNQIVAEIQEAKHQAIRRHIIIASDPTQARRQRIAGIDPLEQCFEQQATQIRRGCKSAQQWAHPRECGPAIPTLRYSGFKMERKTDALFLPNLSLACVGICADVHEHADRMRGESIDFVRARSSASGASSKTSFEGLACLCKRKILILCRTEPIRLHIVPANGFAIIKEIMRDESGLADQERSMDEWLRKQASTVLGISAPPAPLIDEAQVENSRNSNDVLFAAVKQAC